ncbi:hypothetical protein HPP92_021466 [Vanilla planifolia]|uniref:CASP-like protein n=1 Tax=Vanilla planifolia TaxID=51239 RepID=A0A835Q2E9_VANPL|nr:hypothetical protein HPP92_021466 [Vanilla planifolia]
MVIESMEEAMSSPLRSPLPELENYRPTTDAIVAPAVERDTVMFPSPSQKLPATAKAAVRGSPEVKEESKAENSQVVRWILRRRWRVEAVKRAAVAARIAAAALCLVSFSVMAADKQRGWASDHFDRYKEYRYCVSVNVIGFVYAGFQAYAEVYHMSSKRHIIRRPVGSYFDFAMDQILAYLLISASSSATARTNYWVVNWGADPFPNMISAAVAVSFLAFVAFAFSSLISAYNLFNRTI